MSAVALLLAFTASAANGTWSGTASGANAFWTNSLNWSASPYPVGPDTALFTTDGNGQTNIDIAGLSYLKYITFDTALVGPYTFGTGAANSQTLVLADSGEIKLSAAAGNSQIFNGGIQLGVDRTAQSYSLRNDSPSQLLTFNDVFSCGPEISGNAGTKTLNINGTGPVAILGTIRQNGASTFTLTDANSSTLSLAGSNVINVLNMYGGSASVVDIGNKELVLNGAGGNVLNCTMGGTITGTGKLRLSTWDGYSSSGYNYADLNVSPGKALVINCEITGAGGLESNNGAGTFVLNGTNTFLGHLNLGTAGGTISVSTIGNRGIASNCGMGTNLYFGNSSRLLYTGTGEDTDRLIVMGNYDPTIEQAGPGGTLRFKTTPMLISASRTLTVQGTTAGVGAFSAPLANTGSYTLSIKKAGDGTWVFSGTNTYTGTTTVNGGKLLINSPGSLASGSAVTVNSGAILGGNGVINGAVTVAAGGVLAPGDVNTVGALIISNALSLTSGTLLFDVSNVATDKVVVTGALTVNGTNTVVLNFPVGGLPSGTYTLMTNTSSRTGTGSFALSPAYVNATLVTNAASLKLVVVNTGAYGITWQGTVSGSWDGTDQNWTNGSTAVAFTPGDAALFDDTAASFAVGSASPVLPGSVLFNNSASNYAVSAAIGGTGMVFKLGTGAVTLSGNNTYSGQTTIVAGSLTIGGSGVLGGGNYATNIIANGDLFYASSVAQTNSGVISGGGMLTQSGSGLLTLFGNNTYLGPTIVTSGVLRVQNANALGSTTVGTAVAPGAALELAGGITTAAEALDLSGTLASRIGTNTFAGVISLQRGATIDVSADAALIVNTTTINVGSNDLFKTGPGLLRFTADPNHLGMFTINDGVVELQHSGTIDTSFLVNTNGTLREITANDLSDNYPLQVEGALDMRTSDTFGGLSGSGLITNSGSSSAAITVGGNNQSGSFSGVIRNGAGAATLSLTKANTGFQTLSGASTYSGGTTLSGGQLNINNGGTSSANSAIGIGTFTISGYTIDNTSGASVSLLPTIAQNWNGDFTFIGSKSLNLGSGAVTLSANRIVTVLTNTLTVGGAISGAFSMTKNGAGSLALSGANTYSGATTVNGGTLLVNGSTVASSAITVSSGVLGGSGTINGTVNLSAGSVLAPGAANSIGTLTLANNSAASLTLNGNTLFFDLGTVAGTCDKADITGASGKLVLNGTNTVALSLAQGAAPAGSYTLMSCAGGITTNAGAVLQLQSAYPGATLRVVGNNVVLALASDLSGLTWKGNISSSWDGTDANWTNGSAAVTFAAGNAVTFDDTAAGNFSVSSGLTVSPTSVRFNNSIYDYSLSALIGGTAPFVKQGSATVTLTGTSAYNPASVAVYEGTLVVGGTGQLNGGNYAGNMLDNGTLVYSNSTPQTLSGIVAGGGTLTLSGNSTLTLAGANTFNGLTTVNSGVLKVQHANALGATTSGTIVNPGATLELAGNVSTLAEALTLNGILSNQTGSNTFGGTVTLAAGAAIDVGAGSTLVLKGFQANGPFVKTGTGWMKLTTDPNGNGMMTVRNGVVEITTGTMDACVVVNAGASLVATVANAFNDTLTRISLDAGSSYVIRQSDVIGGLAGAGTITQDLNAPATLAAGNNNFAEAFSGVMQNGSGVLSYSKLGTGVQTLTGANTYSGATIVALGTLLVNSPGSLAGTAVTVSNNATLGGDGTIGGPVTVLSGGNLLPGGLSALGTLSLGSTLSLNGGALSFGLSASGTACAQVAIAGSLSLNGMNTVALTFPAGTAPAGDYTLMTFASTTGTGSFALLGTYPNASLVLNSSSLVLHVTGTGANGLTWNGNLSALWDGGNLNWKAGATASSFSNGDSVQFDDSASAFTVGSGGTVTPSAILFNNSINQYYLAVALGGTAPLVKSGTSVAVLNGPTTIYNPASFVVNAGTLVFANAFQLNSGTYNNNILLNGNFNHYSSANLTLNGTLYGVGSLTKSGGGTLTLSGTNSYSAGTTLSSGTLVNRGAVFGFGPGTLTASGGTVDLQNDTGLTFTNNVSLTGNPTLKAGRMTTGAGVTHSLGTLSIGNNTLYVAVGGNVSANTPYGLTFGATSFSAATPVFDVANNGTALGTLTLGALSGAYNFNKQNVGLLFLPAPGSRSAGTLTLVAGTVKLGNPTALGTTGTALQLNAGTLDLACDSSVAAYNTTVGGNVTSQCDRATANSAGITHTLGTLSMGAFTLYVTNGPNVLAASPYGLVFAGTTLTGNSTFDVGFAGTLTLGAISGNYTLTKRNSGTLKLSGVNTYNGATTVNNGKLLGVTGGSSASSAVTVQSTGVTNAVAKLGVLCATTNGTWTCSSLTFGAPTAPAITNPTLEFAFSVIPGGITAPLQVTGAATFTVTPNVSVYLGNLSATNGVYPLMTVGSSATKPVPALTVVGGYSGSTLAWVGNTLYLTLNGSPSPILWGTGALGSGIWDMNNNANLVWKDGTAASTYYQEQAAGATGDRVIFDDSYITTNTTVTLNSIVNPTSLAFSNSVYSYTVAGAGGVAGTIGLTKDGSNTVTLANPNGYSGATVVNGGTLKIGNGGVINHSLSDLVVGTTALTNALLRIENGGFVTNRWLVTGITNGAVGAVYNLGTLASAGGANVTNFVLGLNPGGYGYYRHDSLVQLTMQETGIGGAYNGIGVMDVMQGVVTNASYFQLNRGQLGGQQYSQLNLLGGSLIMPNSAANAHYYYYASTYGQGVINVGSGGFLGSAGTLTELDMIKASTSASALAVLNILSGGTVQATCIKATQSAGLALVNFNGGALRVNYATYNSSSLLGGSAIDRATIYSQGATIDTYGFDVTVLQPLMAPPGNGVTYIPVTANGTGYIGRPIVTLTGGGGTGATAIAEFDPTSQQVTGVTITSPGFSYSTAPSVSFIGGGGTAPTLGSVSIAANNVSGGLTKIGAGVLTLSGVNTYGGMTIISNGTLRLGVANALPTNAPITIAGGILDLNGFTVTNSSINLISGSIINGKVVAPTLQGTDAGMIQAQIVSTNGLIKSGIGTLTISAPQTYPGATTINGGTLKLSGRQPGLYEGRVSGSFDLSTANPKTATPLSTRYANMWFLASANSGGIWPDNTTYIYTGYLWNDAATNETWTFFRCFDDSTRIMINGSNVLQNATSAALVTSNATVNAGWNTFELRLGQGVGSVGNNNSAYPSMGVAYDRMGRNQQVYSNFKTLADPGDGSLLTLTNLFNLAGANLLPTNSAVTIASGATLDLGGTGQKLGGLNGSGMVSNGTLTVIGTIAPAGTNVIGTLTLATTSATLSGTLRVDVSDDGSCDVLSVKGDVNMSGLALSVEDVSQLDRHLQYTVMTCTGTRTGTFSSKNLPSGWVVSYAPNGDVVLMFAGGTLIRLF